MASLQVLILAAGSSSRMGRSKQLLQIDGEALLTRTIEAVKTAGISNEAITVVLGSNYEQHRTLIQPLHTRILHHVDWENGMGSSIKYGLAHIVNENPAGLLILVCDQPLLTPTHLLKLIDQFNEMPTAIIASGYNNTVGVPVIFPSAVWSQLTRIEDHQGAKNVMKQNEDKLITVDFPEGAIDLDTPEDHDAFKKR